MDGPVTRGLPVVTVAQAPGMQLALHLSPERCAVSTAGMAHLAIGADAPGVGQSKAVPATDLPEKTRNALGPANVAKAPWGTDQIELFCGKYNLAVLTPVVNSVKVSGSGSSSEVDQPGQLRRTLIVAGPPGQLYMPPVYPGLAPPP
ncbi:hypothetical protein [Amycolatopsis taiwanensis]|uniref:Uncharacterized protein n=1 Tax=Amycolatopsis taiwanensis TaxID=342230 RepID=A0A9W6R078_9PSEU|nr:hypothetical protein [Amycolatopsis taiwanensis]GLY66060.1 hypothetical protein Atai01_26790 [Amycolatopsis taiwanensis]